MPTRPALYVALHAANTGRGVHVFTSMTDASSLSIRDFLPWERAQTAYLDTSSVVAGSVAAELESRTLQQYSACGAAPPDEQRRRTGHRD